MAITYPLNTPTNIGIANITLMAESAVAVSQSPFTFTQQVVAHPGQRWAASVSLPPMKRVDAENWIAFLLSLKGQVGTFLLGDPNGVSDQGVAAERRNLLTYTEQFDNAAWFKDAATISVNAITAPDGKLTADKLVENTATAAHDIYALQATQPIGTFTYSLYVKTSGRTKFRLQQSSITAYAVLFDLVTMTVTTVAGGAVGAITAVGDNWYRCSMTYTTAASFAPTLALFLVDAAGSLSYTGDGTSGLYIWGAQLEKSSSASAYQGVVDTFGPFVNGANQTGNVLNIDGCSPNVTGYFLPGDYIQLGSGSGSQLYKVLTSVDTNNSGQATVDIWPNLRSSPADNSAVVFTNAKGKFRLKDNVTQWGINEISSYGITFDCVEAL